MRSWTRASAQCLFCELRGLARLQTIRAYQTEAYLHRSSRRHRNTEPDSEHSTTSFSQSANTRPGAASWRPKIDGIDRERLDGKEKQRAEDIFGKPDAGHHRSAKRSPKTRQREDGFDRGKSKSGYFSKRISLDDEEFQIEKLTERSRRTLDELRSKLSQPEEKDAERRIKIDLLDPDGTKWPSFLELLSNALKGSKASTHEENILREELLAASRKPQDDFETAVYFAFLDHCFGKISTNALRIKHDMAIDLRYPTEWYVPARKIQRQIHLHVGPTNSGKTYSALKKLQESQDGFYAGPLRLLAHEVYSRFKAKGIACDLLTGDDIRYDDSPETKLSASTVEMVSVGRECKVAVIDEIQMMADPQRGWAWTRAFLGASAEEVHLCGETRMVPLIRELTASLGDTLHIHDYQRLNPLKPMSKSLRGDLKALRKGDCIVSFSIVNIHALKKEIEVATGRRVAIVYGSLPPEIRAQQADLFNDPDNDYDFLVASDAVGMGLNLSIKRMIFEGVRKRVQGLGTIELDVPSIKQISGRAGRFRTAQQDKTQQISEDGQDAAPVAALEPGLVTTLSENDLPVIRRALSIEPEPVKQAYIMPPAEYLDTLTNALPPGVPFEYIMSRVCASAEVNPRYKISSIRDNLTIARMIENIHPLTTEQRVLFCACPIVRHDKSMQILLRALATVVAQSRSVSIVDMPEIQLELLSLPPSSDRAYLASLEILHKTLIMYLWLSYRFSFNFTDRPMATHAKELVEQKIDQTLKDFSANKTLQKRLVKMKEINAAADVTVTKDESEESEESDEFGGLLTELAAEDGRPTNLHHSDILDAAFDPEAQGNVRHQDTVISSQISTPELADEKQAAVGGR